MQRAQLARLARLSAVTTIVTLALSIFACTKSQADSGTTTGAGAVTAPGAGKRSVDIVANEKGFAPTSVEVAKGQATTLVFKRTTDETCAKEVVFPELKVTKELPLNQPVAFDVPSDTARTLTFQCGMGMFKGKVVVQ
jgi:plastocyanin domain-containing protein